MTDITDSETVSNEIVCSECETTNILPIKKCACCSDLICDLCKAETVDGPVCSHCLTENYFTCTHCSDQVHSDDMFLVDDDAYCESCRDEITTSCECCGGRFLTTRMFSDDSISVCESCYEDRYTTCSSCHTLVLNANLSCCDCDNVLCSDCYLDRSCCGQKDSLEEHADRLCSEGQDAIADYHPAIEWEFLTSKQDLSTNPFFGVEIEVEEKDDCALHHACKYLGKNYAGKMLVSHDGSLKNGMEIIFTPHKRDAFRKLNIRNLFKQLKHVGCNSYDPETCGMHVHIERTGFLRSRVFSCYPRTYAQLYQTTFNVLREWLTTFSKRTEEQISNYCNFSDSAHNRYSAVNLGPSDTIEIRIWRGTLDYKRFQANLLFTLAWVDFLKQYPKVFFSMRTRDFSERKLLKGFKDWLNRADEYQHLKRYLNDHNL